MDSGNRLLIWTIVRDWFSSFASNYNGFSEALIKDFVMLEPKIFKKLPIIIKFNVQEAKEVELSDIAM